MKYYHGKLKNEVEVKTIRGVSERTKYLYDSFEDDESALAHGIVLGGELLDRISLGGSSDYREAKAANLVKSVLRTAVQCHSRGSSIATSNRTTFCFRRKMKIRRSRRPISVWRVSYHRKVKCSRVDAVPRATWHPKSSSATTAVKPTCGPGVVAYQLLERSFAFVDTKNARPNAKEVFRAILEDDIDLSVRSVVFGER